jgi:anti-sigma factor RsiW
MTETLAMDCDELVELVTEYLEASLDPATRARVEAHVTECPGCMEILDQFRATVALTGALRPTDAAAVDPTRRTELLARFREWHAGSA